MRQQTFHSAIKRGANTRGANDRGAGTRRASTRGAALLVAIGILAVLLVISVTFFRMTTMESQVANNYANSIQAELGVDAAIAIAIHELQKDAQQHPAVTSSDHAWRSKFNGTWAVGKSWAYGAHIYGAGYSPALYPNYSFNLAKGVPMVDFDYLRNYIIDKSSGDRDLVDIGQIENLIYIPRVDRTNVFDVPDFIDDDPNVPGFINEVDGTINPEYYLLQDGSENPLFPFVISTERATFNPLRFPGNFNNSDRQLVFPNPFDPTDLANPYDLTVIDRLWLPEQQIHFITDVDNDRDGLNDSIWLPLAADRLFPNDGLDNDLDGFIDEFDLDGEPGIFMYTLNYLYDPDILDDDDDRTNFYSQIRLTISLERMFTFFDTEQDPPRWEPIGVTLQDISFQPPNDETRFDIEVSEKAYTISNAYELVAYDELSGDDVDNDFNGFIDDGIDASHYYLNRNTRQYLQNDPIIINHYSYPSLLAKIGELMRQGFEIRILGEPVSNIIGRQAILITDESSKVNINQAGALTYISNKAQRINPVGPLPLPDNALRLHSTPMTRSTGTGVSSHEYDMSSLDGIDSAFSDRLWTMKMGSSFDDHNSFVNGSALSTVSNESAIFPATDTINSQTPGFGDFTGFAYDISFPGYGFVDDNGSALWMATNGIDDDGDAFWYQHDGIDNDLNGRMDNGYFLDDLDPNNDILADPFEGQRVGVDEGLIPYDYNGDGLVEYATLEGIDEPGESQYYRPFRNIVAEQNVISPTVGAVDGNFNLTVGESGDSDNDSDGIVDEIGEFGDRSFRTTEQIKDVGGNGDALFSRLETQITVHSTDSNLARNYRDGLGVEDQSTHTANGIKLDFNFATPREIVNSLLANFPYDPSTPEIVDALNNEILFPEKLFLGANPPPRPFRDFDLIAANFAAGLRQEDTTFVSATGVLNVLTADLTQTNPDPLIPSNTYEQVRIPADAELRAYQLAVSAKDFTDTNHSRSTLDLTVPDPWLGGNNTLTYTQAGVEAIRINEIMVRPVRRVEAEATPNTNDEFDPNLFSQGNEIPDFNFTVLSTLNLIQGLQAGTVPIAIDPPLFEDDIWQVQSGRGVSTAELANAIATYPLMGIRSAYAVYKNYTGIVLDNSFNNVIDIQSALIPNVLEFSFYASPQLPAGRYYLSVNTQFVNDVNTTSNNELDLVNSIQSNEELIYYVTTGHPDFSYLSSVMDHILESDRIYRNYMDFRIDEVRDEDTGFLLRPALFPQSPAVLGYDANGVSTGMAFLQGSERNKGFTVEIPEDPTQALHIAIMRAKSPEDPFAPLAINYFEFSQEPDHEWVELANVSDQTVDLSGWRLVVEGDSGIEMTIPDYTFIAPKGYLLLGTNKFDYMNPATYDPFFNNTLTPTLAALTIYNQTQTILSNLDEPLYINSLRTNGIGLATGLVPGLTPIQNEVGSPISEYDNVESDWFTALGSIPGQPDKYYENITVPPTFGITRTPFIPGTRDFIDIDGNGLSDDDTFPMTISQPLPQYLLTILASGAGNASGIVPDNSVQSSFSRDEVILGLIDEENQDFIVEEIKPWDRIVELIIPALDHLDTPGEIGNLVLRGGIFPNYPEYDGIDNDSDNAVLRNDPYDNDGDGFISDTALFEGIEVPVEGIDEGRFRLHPENLWFGSITAMPGAYQQAGIPLNILIQNALTTVTYPVNSADPPDWKAFVEKRLFPGDNVIVSLYEGTREDDPGTRVDRPDHIVDSISYTELDVINRTIDDILPYPFADSIPNADYPSIWPANTMGIDFYKSLERKHPLYNGDKHGVTNRSQPTDGRYDDWADSSQYSMRDIRINNRDALFSFSVATDTVNIFADDRPGYNLLFDHTQFGSPLRMNLSQRKMENPANTSTYLPLVLREGQFENAAERDQETGLPLEGGVLTARRTIFPLPGVRNKAIVSPGDLLNLPHFDRIQRTRANILIQNDTSTGFPIDFSALNQRITLGTNDFDIPRFTDDSVRQVMIGHTFGDENLDAILFSNPSLNNLHFSLDFRERDDSPENDLSNDLAQLISNAAANDSLSLSVATAKVIPFEPISPLLNLHTYWDVNTSTNPVGDAIDWAPVLLFPIIDDDPDLASTFQPYPNSPVDYDKAYLFNSDLSFVNPAIPFDNVIPDTVTSTRWPYQRRAVTYASRNDGNFTFNTPPDAPREGSEALFIWDGNDGLENGEYDVYIAVHEDLRTLLKNRLALTDFGADFVAEALRTDYQSMLMDVEIFTDRDANGRVWASSTPEPELYSDLNSGAKATTVNESFEQLLHAVPDRNGFINYGAVTIENNYLALFIRNRADSTVLNRISRVVLAPRAKTPGRININTIETHLTANQNQFFNPVHGLPGIQSGFHEFQGTFGHNETQNPVPTTRDNFEFYVNSLPDLDNTPSRSETNEAIHFRSQKLTRQRGIGQNIHADGRYYESVTDLVKPTNVVDLSNPNALTIRKVYPTILSELPDNQSNRPNGQSFNEYDFNDNQEIRRFRETQNRFSRMVNMITTRSDVFKIQVTVQIGSVSDNNGDGILNYRDDQEFTVTSEKTATTIYER